MKIWLICTFLLTSCSGYRLKRQAHSLKQSGVSRISVPMFINNSIHMGLAEKVTDEIIQSLAEIPGMKVYNSEDPKSDAVLIGIIYSPHHFDTAFKRAGIEGTISKWGTSSSYSYNELPGDSVDPGDAQLQKGSAEGFGDRAARPPQIPAGNSYSVSVQLVLIKNPTFAEIKLAKSSYAPHLIENSKVIFNRVINTKGSYRVNYYKNSHPDSGGPVNFTITKQNYYQSYKDLSKNIASSFKATILNVF